MKARTLAVLFLPATLLARSASATADADALLKRAYDNYRAGSSTSTVTMTIHRPDWERQMSMKAWTRGDNDALVRFVAPAKDAGNATLKLADETWIFDPRLNQVIKLPASMMAQSWMGSDFSYNDLAKSEDLLTQYDHRIIGVETSNGHTVTTLEADPKPDAPVVWGKVVVKLRDDDVVTEETFFDQDMKPAKRMTSEKIASIGGRTYPVVMTMRPLDEPGLYTRIETTAAAFNIAVPDYLFTLSNLQNPRQAQ
jgi:outer membrane lipoprotein-sorting protein